MQSLIQANVNYLQQVCSLVKKLDDSLYVRKESMFYDSTVGGHLRHCLDHYEAFLKGVVDGKIDYDARDRDQGVECETRTAEERILTIISQLESLCEGEICADLLVKMDCGEVSNSVTWQPSSMGRELQFLISHTVHHFAMIRGICQNMGEELPLDFGMAPSTLRYRKSLACTEK